jgi:hypothetical protein
MPEARNADTAGNAPGLSSARRLRYNAFMLLGCSLRLLGRAAARWSASVAARSHGSAICKNTRRPYRCAPFSPRQDTRPPTRGTASATQCDPGCIQSFENTGSWLMAAKYLRQFSREALRATTPASSQRPRACESRPRASIAAASLPELWRSQAE